ncbi:MAG TPA: response regulator [Gemmatimonadaceae bacterium]|nr:response regulator [Gemmatimonadaceae bacterium]
MPLAAPPVDIAALTGTETILVTDDTLPVRKLATQILQTYGYHVLGASNAKEALEVCRMYDGQIDLLLTDVVMPEVFGGTLAQEATRVRPDLKVLFMSVHSRETFATYGALAEDTDLLEKPFSPIALVTKVRERLDSVAPPASTKAQQ